MPESNKGGVIWKYREPNKHEDESRNGNERAIAHQQDTNILEKNQPIKICLLSLQKQKQKKA